MGSSDKSQSHTFLHGEGDAWFNRNLEQLKSSTTQTVEVDFIINSLVPFRGQFQNILEIGCGSGIKLTKLSESFQADGFGIDASGAAIMEAQRLSDLKDSRLSFEVGLATNLPYENEKFDFILFGFCLYLIPPNETYAAIMEANRVLKNGGFLAIVDFDYGGLKINPYKHAPGLFSFKNSYSQIFMASHYYSLVSKWSFSHTNSHFIQDREERISVEVLFKEVL